MIHEARRTPRRQVAGQVPVFDVVAERGVGQVGNLSENGMLLLSTVPLNEDALYQLRFPLPDSLGQAVQIDVGVHLLWQVPAQAPGQYWAGFRFLTIEGGQRDLLRRWVDTGHPAN